MFSLLRGAFTLLICVLILGFFLGWFTFRRTPTDPRSNNVDISVSVDKRKVGTDLQHFEQKVNKGIQDLSNAPPGGNPPPGGNSPPSQPFPWAGQGARNQGPQLSIGPVTVQPNNQFYNPQPAPPPAQPQLRVQTPDFQFSLPVGTPAGEGR